MCMNVRSQSNALVLDKKDDQRWTSLEIGLLENAGAEVEKNDKKPGRIVIKRHPIHKAIHYVLSGHGKFSSHEVLFEDRWI